MARDNYSSLLQRIQQEMDVADITPDNIAMFLAGHDIRGKTLARRRLGTMLANILSEETKIARTITLTNEFAQEKGIKLTEKTKGGVYQNWGRYGKRAVVIFDTSKGGNRIKSWKYF